MSLENGNSNQSAGKCPVSHGKPGRADDAGGAGTGERAVSLRVLGCPVPKWARWPVAGAFMFFLIKGLVWIALAMVVWWRSCAA